MTLKINITASYDIRTISYHRKLQAREGSQKRKSLNIYACRNISMVRYFLLMGLPCSIAKNGQKKKLAVAGNIRHLH